MKMNEVLQIRIDPERLSLLKDAAEAHGTTMSEVIRAMIDTVIYRPEHSGGDDGQWKSIVWYGGSAKARYELEDAQ
jgi:hypothetical protein